MKELSINQEAGIFQAVYKLHCPDYFSNSFNKKKKFQNYDYEQDLGFNYNNDKSISFLLNEPQSPQFGENSIRTHISQSLICDLCGRSGHDYKHCPKIPSIEQLELSIKNDILYAENKILQNSEKKKLVMSNQNQSDETDPDVMNSRVYAEDHFGLYVVDGGENDPIQIDGSLENDLYCINCGKKGHTFTNCPKPNLTEILDCIGNMNSYYNNNYNNNYNNISSTNVKRKFDLIWGTNDH
ncbi:hypothetical protein M9Y10_042431 [Tritrichomonas musculus]|uniref:CCHC-type domain-containing protein n=1 Tax=Tritrichomonas musculus TaxID=1915356 RepID=A0ABR2GNM2_9EUKA